MSNGAARLHRRPAGRLSAERRRYTFDCKNQ
jgi:hypothetical protein